MFTLNGVNMRVFINTESLNAMATHFYGLMQLWIASMIRTPGPKLMTNTQHSTLNNSQGRIQADAIDANASVRKNSRCMHRSDF